MATKANTTAPTHPFPMSKRFLAPALLALLLPSTNGIHAAQEIVAPPPTDAKDKKVLTEPEKASWFPCDPASRVTLGVLASRSLTGGYADLLTGIYATQPRDKFYFLESNYHLEDDGQFVSSVGVGFREHIPGKDVILGVNAFYDSIDSFRDNHFDQLGMGAEMLTRWVDARLNYYLPDNNVFVTDTYHSRGNSYSRYESGIEGFDLEVGFLIPGLDRYVETRVFAGYYRYNNPWGRDWEGFKARLEARLLPCLTANVAYWDDTYLMGGHWTGEVRVTLPLSFFCLLRGQNPFSDPDFWKPEPRNFDDRMSDMIEREHRIMTAVSDRQLTHRGHENLPPPQAPGPLGNAPANFIPFE